MAILRECQADLDYFHQRVMTLLGEPVRLFHLTYDLEAFLIRQARRRNIAGLGMEPAICRFHSGLGGHLVHCGLVHYAVTIGGTLVPVVNIINPFGTDRGGTLNDVWAVPARHYGRLYRFLRRGQRARAADVAAPIMRPEDQSRLWDNTLGFLERGEQALCRFGVALKRGVMLMGEPGNGKTLAARWLYSQAQSLGIEWKTVTAEEYESARSDGSASELFQLNRPGVILFDDFDQALRNREQVGPGVDSSMFLAELDGIDVRSGVVYLFTSNARLDELDPAFRRPGRIDQIIHFPRPDADLRRRLIVERWPAEVVTRIPVDEIAQTTVGCSFAEVDEIKKLLVMRFLQTDVWDWPWAWNTFSGRGDDVRPKRPLGFAASLPAPAQNQSLAMESNA